ncbi:AAA family ATPase [Candidatus Daviesbacteria bacterium]|nr:AAA family ATPase [Candidatus Daviesbacteria bacterium]
MNVEHDNIKKMQREISPPKENEFILRGRIIISGHPGTGKSVTIDRLATRYGLSPDMKIKVGDFFRKRALETTGKHLGGYYERAIGYDHEIDEMQKGLLMNTDPNFTFILESKLGGFFAREIKMQNPQQGQTIPQIVSILLTCDNDIRYARVYNRDKKKRPELTRDQSRKETSEREILDLKQWRKIHPALQGIDPLNPSSKDMYDIYIDTTYFDTKEVEERIHSQLLRIGTVVKK